MNRRQLFIGLGVAAIAPTVAAPPFDLRNWTHNDTVNRMLRISNEQWKQRFDREMVGLSIEQIQAIIVREQRECNEDLVRRMTNAYEHLSDRGKKFVSKGVQK